MSSVPVDFVFLCRQIIRSAERMPGFLNRQYIILLSTLGVPDLVFQRLQDQVILSMRSMLSDKEVKNSWHTSKFNIVSKLNFSLTCSLILDVMALSILFCTILRFWVLSSPPLFSWCYLALVLLCDVVISAVNCYLSDSSCMMVFFSMCSPAAGFESFAHARMSLAQQPPLLPISYAWERSFPPVRTICTAMSVVGS